MLLNTSAAMAGDPTVAVSKVAVSNAAVSPAATGLSMLLVGSGSLSVYGREHVHPIGADGVT
jgi:hypothetical protein